jgi:hypothetical protein
MSEVYASGVWDWLEANHGRRYPWSYFGYHVYVDQDVASDGQKMQSYLDEITALAKANGDAAPVLITEIGWQASPGDVAALERQRQNLQTSFDLLEERSDVAGVFWFGFRDFPGKSWGIDGKPAADELAAQPRPAAQGSPSRTRQCEHSPCAEARPSPRAATRARMRCARAVRRAAATAGRRCVTIAADTPGLPRRVCGRSQQLLTTNAARGRSRRRARAVLLRCAGAMPTAATRNGTDLRRRSRARSVLHSLT